MKYLLLLLTITSAASSYLSAQHKRPITGIYSLEGVRETASGFKLSKDSTFEFYFSYGALDRYGSGRWRMRDSQIVLTSSAIHLADFKITDSVPSKGKSAVIQISDKNKMFFRYL